MRRQRSILILVPLILTLALCVGIEGAARVTEYRWRDIQQPVITTKGHGIRRVFFYGESTVHGTPVPAFGFVEQLRFYLRDQFPGQPFELINLGVPGISSTQILQRIRSTIRSDVDLAVLAIGHNEFLNPAPDPESQFGRYSATYRAVQHFKTVRERQASATSGTDRTNVAPVDRQSPVFAAKQEIFRRNVHEMIRVFHSYDVPLVVATLGSNVRDWRPVFRSLPANFRDSSYERDATLAIALLENRKPDSALPIANRLTSAHADDAVGAFVSGRLMLKHGDVEQARTLLRSAKDLDPVPWRVLSAFNHMVDTIAGVNEVRVLHLDSLLEAHAAQGGAGFDMYADNVHPTPEANALIAHELFMLMQRSFELTPRDHDTNACCTLARYWNSMSDTTHRRELLIQYHVRNGQYAMKPPFFDYTTARRFFMRADSMSHNNWKIEANIASVELFEGNRPAALAMLKRASDHAKAAGTVLDSISRGDAPLFRSALRQAGIELKSMPMP